ncbi:MAG TPA: chromosomal replication initiator protein DnaA [Thermoanaerobaculia bacterium]|jgi:chromosomal replication initiator protein|nr:chromosomal replication initiator protein DnaA [Thermoanaerobaculia bacterium]
MASNTLWSQLQKKLQQQLAAEEYETWFRPLRARLDGDRRLVLLAPNERFLSTLEESYRPAIDRALAALSSSGLEILFVLDEGNTSVSPPVFPAAAPSSAVPLEPSLAFNPKYLFANFVVGNSNQFAHAAARAVADRPSSNYNPLFLYGGVGLGKTHLLHAVGHQILALHPHLRVLYLPAEQFVNELINSIRFDRMPAFRERYRTIDALLIDDVQFIANKERTQEEFFHTFNTLYTSQKQIILSSDSSPKDIPTLEERLRSRFQWGLIADIQPPDLETKVAILRKKADFEGVDLPNEVAEFVAQQVKSNIRELEGMLNRVIAFSSLTGKPLSLELARETLRDILPHEGRKPTAAEITKSVARHYGLKVVEIKSKNNSKQISFPRQVAMYLCKRLTDLSYPEIGKQFNDKHHSTVMYSVDKIQQLRQDDSDFDRVLQNLERGLS